MPIPAGDRNLLFAILSLQMEFVTRDALVAAMSTWFMAKDREIAAILIERGDLAEADRATRSGLRLEPNRRALPRRGIHPMIARRRTAHGSGLGRVRWVAERTVGWLARKRKLRIRTERRVDIHGAFLSLGCSLICFHVLMASLCQGFSILSTTGSGGAR